MNLFDLERWIAPLKRRVAGMIAKAMLESLDDSSDLQLAKVTINGETHSDVERIQNYGFTSRPKKGSQAVVLFVGGNRDNPVIIATDDGRIRVKLEDGEAALYNDQGLQVKLTAAGKIELGTGGESLLPALGVLNGQAVDPFTGATHLALGNASTKVFARKT